jgi:hypothetical protein
MSDPPGGENASLLAWATALPRRQPSPLTRLKRGLFRVFRRRRFSGYFGGDPPAEGAVVPVRPKRPAPTLLAAAELELPNDPD